MVPSRFAARTTIIPINSRRSGNDDRPADERFILHRFEPSSTEGAARNECSNFSNRYCGGNVGCLVEPGPNGHLLKKNIHRHVYSLKIINRHDSGVNFEDWWSNRRSAPVTPVPFGEGLTVQFHRNTVDRAGR